MERQAVFWGTFAMVSLLNVHVHINKSGLKKCAEFLWTSRHRVVLSSSLSEDEIQAKQRIEDELHQMRLLVFKMLNSCAIHFDFLMLLCMIWKMLYQPDQVSIFETCESAAPYIFFTIFHSFSLIEVKVLWRVYQVTALSLHVIFAFLRPEIAGDSSGKVQVVSLIALSSSMLDVRVSLPFCCLEGLVNMYKTWDSSDPQSLQNDLAICGVTCILVVIVEELARLHIESRLESGDHFCRLTGFRSVLRGVCDGDILLNEDHHLVEDTTSLERLLNVQKKLTGSNFLNLFPAIEDRTSFLNFLATPSSETPSACRVSLQGSLGPVSLDLFHVRVVNASASEKHVFHLLAIKQDADQNQAIPDADETMVESFDDFNFRPPASSCASEREMAVAHHNLKEITLLLSSHSSSWDIGELHVKYERRHSLDLGMPTLQQFIPPKEWERVLRKIQQLHSSEKLHFRRPLSLRLPGSHKYSKVRKVSVGRANEVRDPILLWMNLRDLDVAAPPGELGGICESD